MLHRAYRLSSSWELVVRECDYPKGIFFKLGYLDRLIDATVTSFLNSVFVEKDQVQKNNAMSEGNIARVILPFKEQRSADFVRKQLKDLGNNIGNPIQTVLTSPKLASNFELRRENHPSLAGNVLYINLNVICAMQIISATLHQRIEEHRATAVGAHVKGCYGISYLQVRVKIYLIDAKWRYKTTNVWALLPSLGCMDCHEK